MDSTVTTMATSPSERLFQSSSSSGDESNETRSMAIRSGMSHSEWNQTFEELKTIQFHIESNRQHIEQLNNRFSGQNPSQFYIMEYEDLTEKLHNLSLIAEDLKKKLRLQSIDISQYDQDHNQEPASPLQPTPVSDSLEDNRVPVSPLVNAALPSTYSYNGNDNNRLTTVVQQDHLALDSPPAHMSSGDEFGSFAAGDHSNSSSQPSSACQPKSPLRAFVRVHLGDLGHTKITTMPGITLANALSKAMKLRKLTMESCVVYNASDPHKVIDPHLKKNREIVLVKGN